MTNSNKYDKLASNSGGIMDFITYNRNFIESQTFQKFENKRKQPISKSDFRKAMLGVSSHTSVSILHGLLLELKEEDYTKEEMVGLLELLVCDHWNDFVENFDEDNRWNKLRVEDHQRSDIYSLIKKNVEI